DDLLLAEAHAALRETAVRDADRLGRRLAEQQIELGGPEDERVRLIHQRAVEVIAHRVGQPRGELQPAEPGAQDDDAHRASLRGAPELRLLSRSRAPRRQRRPVSTPHAAGTSATSPRLLRAAGTPRRTAPPP